MGPVGRARRELALGLLGLERVVGYVLYFVGVA